MEDQNHNIDSSENNSAEEQQLVDLNILRLFLQCDSDSQAPQLIESDNSLDLF